MRIALQKETVCLAFYLPEDHIPTCIFLKRYLAIRRQPDYGTKTTYTVVIGVVIPKEVESFGFMADVKSGCGINITAFNDKRPNGEDYIELELEKEDTIALLSFLIGSQQFFPYPVSYRLLKENIPQSKLKPSFDVSKAYDSTTKTLDLTAFNLRGDVTIPMDWNYSMVASSLLENASKKYPGQVDLIDFTSNAIHSTKVFEALKHYHGLTKLIFNNNNIKDISGLPKLSSITSVSFVGNPVVNTANYKEVVHSKFPNLVFLDGQDALVFKFKEAIDRIPLTPRIIGSHYCEDQNLEVFTETFLQQFFTEYDGNRGKLAYTLYREQSSFSLSVPHDLFDSYKRFSSNTLKGVERTIIGVEKIRECFEAMPATVHDFTTITYDSFVLPRPSNTSFFVQISAYGLCQDSDKEVRNLSFSRTWILEVSKANVEEKRVVSDLLNLRKI